MHILQIEHSVPSYDGWKQAFDNDPINRAKMGVLSYRVMRPVGDEHYVVIELDFATRLAAEACHSALRTLWTTVQGTVMNDPQARIVELVEERTP